MGTRYGVERLRQNGVSFIHHYPIAAACAPSRASLLTGQYPSLHGVTQTDGISKAADGDGLLLSIDDDGKPIASVTSACRDDIR